MISVNALGDACPLPVVKTIDAIKSLNGAAGTVEVLVDNDTAVQNLKRLADSKGYAIAVEQQGEKRYRAVLTVGEQAEQPELPAECCPVPAEKKTVVVISSDRMGDGDEALGKTLLKGFLFALRQQDTLPKTILFYNRGAFVSTEGSASVEDLKDMEARGVEILTCGTCLNYYGLTEKLAVGGVTNMYSIVEAMTGADRIVKP